VRCSGSVDDSRRRLLLLLLVLLLLVLLLLVLLLLLLLLLVLVLVWGRAWGRTWVEESFMWPCCCEALWRALCTGVRPPRSRPRPHLPCCHKDALKPLP
jgi:hypothetical protein